MDKIKLVAILRGIQPAEAADHIETLINAGFRYIEIPLNSPDWQQSIPAMVRQFGERAMIGAGTVLKVEQVDFLAEAGAKLIVTPNTAPAVIRRAVDKGMLVCAGCATASEAFSAQDAGAQWLKNLSVISIRRGLYSRAESGVAAGGSGAGGRRRDAGKSGDLDTGGVRRCRSGQRSLSRRTGRGTYPRAGGEVYLRQ